VNIIKCEVALLFTRAAMSNPNGLVSQKLCHYLNQGRTLNGILPKGRTVNGLL